VKPVVALAIGRLFRKRRPRAVCGARVSKASARRF